MSECNHDLPAARLRRRSFLRLAAASALAPPWASKADPLSGALEAHWRTRNTWLGPSGAGSLFSEPPLPYKTWPGAPRLRLPDAAGVASLALAATVHDSAPSRAFSGEAISLPQLAWLLKLTNGVTGVVRGSDPPEYRRAAPSAGALYAGEVYVVAEGVSGLAPGVYSYAVAEHELVELRLGSGLGGVENAAAVVLIANVFERYAWKYGRRGWRYAFLDTGHIGENLRLAAASAGLAGSSPLDFDDAAQNALLGLDGESESVCALHAVGWPVEPPATALAPAPGPTVEACIRARRSARVFRSDPIAARELALVLEMAQGHAASSRSPGVELRLFAHRVAGLEAGLYRYLPGERRLEPLRLRNDSTRLVRACLFQEKAGTAAVGIACVGDLAAAGSERGYRALLLEAGAIAERVYLAAEASGLAARNLAAFFDDSLNDLLDVDGEQRAAIHLTMLGREAES